MNPQTHSQSNDPASTQDAIASSAISPHELNSIARSFQRRDKGASVASGQGATGRRQVTGAKTDGIWRAIRGPAGQGLCVIVVFALTFGVWAAMAPLDGGAIAPGVVSPDGSKKTVQHLEGGIIAKLYVRDGDVVFEGQPLMVLESVQPKANHDVFRADYFAQLATRIRLEAEKSEAARLVFPASLLAAAANDHDVRRTVDDQRHLFETRLAMHKARQRVLRQRVGQLEEQIRGIEAQVQSTEKQLVLIADELRGKSHLVKLNLLIKPELLRMERLEAELGGRRGELVSTIARLKQQIGETELQLLSLDAERFDQIATQIDVVRTKFAEVEQKLSASKDILNRTVIVAPAAGIVLNLKFKTEGGVVLRGDAILDIVPQRDNLLIDARVSPGDIDVVRAGLPALVNLTAYNSRGTPRVNGNVRLVSADRLIDEVTKQPYFLARIEVNRGELDRLSIPVELLPGMPAEAMIVTEQRTLLSYLVQPFLEAWRRSFREV